MIALFRRLGDPAHRQMMITLVVTCALFMEILDGTVIATALPQMARTFHENPVNLGIGISAYLITLAVFIPSSGWVADRIGSKTTFASAIVIFTGASMLCGISNALWAFVLARIVQGVGGAMMVPVGRLVVLRSTDKRDLVRTSQLLVTPALVAPVIGAPIGGFITTYASWRWIFFLNLPLGVLGLVLVLWLMTNYKSPERRRFDWLGFALSGAGLAALVFGLDQFARPQVVWPTAIALTLVGALICVAAVVHFKHAEQPLLDLTLFRIPTFRIATLFAGSSFRSMVGTMPFLWPLLFQLGFGMTAFQSGLVVMTCAAGDLTMKFFSVRALRRLGYRRTLVWNGALAALTILACALFTPATPLFLIIAVLMLHGASRSLQFGSINSLAYVDVPPPRMSSATSIAITLQQLMWGVGIAFGAIALHLAAFLRGDDRLFAVGDFQVAFVLAAVVAFSSAIISLQLDPTAGAHASGHQPSEPAGVAVAKS